MLPRALLLVLPTFFALSSAVPGGGPAKVKAKPTISAGWFAGWHAANSEPAFTVADIPWSKYTNVQYSFAETTDDVKVLSLKGSEPAELPKFVAAAHKNGVKAGVALGGWTGSRFFSSAVATAKNRTLFTKTILDFAAKYDLDQIDFDWEYPASQGIGCNTIDPKDSTNLLSLLKEIRSHPAGKKLIISAAVVGPFAGPDGEPLSDVSAFSNVLDYVAVMNYDVFGSWSDAVGANAPLNDTCAPKAYRAGSAINFVSAWVDAGFPANKIVLGVAAYGHSFHVAKADAYADKEQKTLALFPPFSASKMPVGDAWDDAAGVDICGNKEGQGGNMNFWGLIAQGYLSADGSPKAGIPYLFDTCSKTPFVYNPTTNVMISFDDARSFAAKGNYIKDRGLGGFISAISAPYQYYKDINPATLTGAVDIIVVSRPTDSGSIELACSPFHVRFGKWQVLRPGDKKVKVSVNGHPIPFDMKIGEAGEAFFVFETDEHVPEDLITSPILQPTRPEQQQTTDVPTDRFGAKQDPEEAMEAAVDASAGAAPSETPTGEPEFLDLNADANSRPTERKRPPELSLEESGPATPSGAPSATPGSMLNMNETQDERVDKLLAAVGQEAPHVEYMHDVALDGEGYHSRRRHDRERTITADDDGSYRSRTPSPTRVPEKAHTEPLPKLEVEYSWEWGAFPQPSPMKATFGLGGRVEAAGGSGKDVPATWGRSKTRGKTPRREQMEFEGDDAVPEEDEEVELSGRSRSVPPMLDGSPTRSRRRPLVYEDEDDVDFTTSPLEVIEEIGTGYGAGGHVTASEEDSTQFTVAIEGKKISFELSLVPEAMSDDEGSESETRGRRDRSGSSGGQVIFDRRDEVDAARRFKKGQIGLEQFLQDESVVQDPRLVIRWAEDQYITRLDGSPLMDALVLWRNALLKQTQAGIPLRPTSPEASETDDSMPSTPTDEEAEAERRHQRAKSEPPVEALPKERPTSSSWVQWWNRSKRESVPPKDDRPPLPWTASAPMPQDSPLPVSKRASTDIPPADSAPAPSTPVQRPVDTTPTKSTQTVTERMGRKFAKTLRLTSDQLKSLNLKHGANSITFSLSASGVIACTARIFVWDSSDHVLVSDIDGTITKSDGLGHVFAMIGRDWTHLGVAKLYTDISRNGYKIMYLTSRAIGQADSTRDYLKGIKQNDYQLPEGPVIMSPDRLMASLHREVIMRKPEVFKMACLRDIQRLFGEGRNPFYAGFGNRITDALSYRSVNVPSSRIFTIDSTGEVKLELLELAGYKSSYIHMTDLVDQMFPPIHRKWTPEYTDFNFWKAPVQEFPLPDLSPPSPALSARSDTSNQSTLARLRNFSLVGSRQSTNNRQAALNKVNATGGARDTSPPPEQNEDLRKMSSFERLSSTISSSFGAGSSRFSSPSPDPSRRSASPASSSSYTYADSDDDEDELDAEGKRVGRRRDRRRSMTSMPGSLDDELQFDMDDDEPGQYDENGGVPYDESGQDEEEALDEDLLAAGEMKNVPFL
ncbi:Nuclear elongation and deformation protein 1 [Mycena kentingensis (nom. inval.)]|nr:Nuclear elongation and deformation protein 1 [Mycena kentingensis (nom. inval.)]